MVPLSTGKYGISRSRVLRLFYLKVVYKRTCLIQQENIPSRSRPPASRTRLHVSDLRVPQLNSAFLYMSVDESLCLSLLQLKHRLLSNIGNQKHTVMILEIKKTSDNYNNAHDESLANVTNPETGRSIR
jgi:hypothetical protein